MTEPTDEIRQFLNKRIIPKLKPIEREHLEASILEEELKRAVSQTHNNQDPKPDGLLSEICKKYGQILLPELLKVLEMAFKNTNTRIQ